MTSRPRTPRVVLAAILLGITLCVAGCGSGGRSQVQLRAARQAASRRAHAGFSIPPCLLVTVAQVSKALGVRVRARTARAGCVYTGAVSGSESRTLTVTPSDTSPAGGELISASATHAVDVTGRGFRARVGIPPTPGDVRVPASVDGGVVAGSRYVTLVVQDSDPDAPSQLSRAIGLAREIGRRLAARR